MKKATFLLTAGALLLAGTASAQRQEPPVKNGFIAFYGGAQPQRHTLIATSTQTVYGETATVKSTQRIRNGALVQVGAGFRVAGPLAIGAGFSMFGRPGTSIVEAQIPHPAFYDQPKTVVADAAEVAHTERGIHFKATWMSRVSDRIDVALSAGPSMIRLRQELTARVSVAPPTQNITLVKTTEEANALGFNAGFDATYGLSPGAGVGIFVQYAGATVDLPSAVGVKVGGIQGGLGLHLRF